MLARSTEEAASTVLATLTRDLCAIPSVTGDEGAIADHLVAWLARESPACQVDRLGHTIVARVAGAPGEPWVLLIGHTDTVPPAHDQEVAIRDGRVLGCGASDMKGALAVMLDLAVAASREPAAPGRPGALFVFYDREEGPISDSTMPALLDSGLLPDAIDLALCLEPTDLRIEAGCVGGLHARVVVSGQRAHSARPWQGVNAITRAIPLLQRLAEWSPRPVEVGGLVFREVVSPTTARTQNGRNVVPDAFELNLNMRFAPDRAPEDAIRELEALVGGAGSFEIVDVAPPGQVVTEHPRLQDWAARHGLTFEAKQAWTDVAQLSAHGIPAANFGPGLTAQAHQAGEYVPVDNLVTARRMLGDLLGLGA